MISLTSIEPNQHPLQAPIRSQQQVHDPLMGAAKYLEGVLKLDRAMNHICF